MPDVETSITVVTVFTNRALVFRHGKASLAAGSSELVVSGLPALLEPDSVRAGGQGNVPVKIAGVRAERIFATEPVAETVAGLEQHIRTLERQSTALDDHIEVLQLQRSFVKGLSEKSIDRFSQGLARQHIDLQAADNLLSFLGKRWKEAGEEIAHLEIEREELTRRREALQEKLQQVRTPVSRESYSLFVAVEAAQTGEFELEIAYFITQARWTPLYDLRVNTTTSTVNLTYLAEVTQQTGEDWTRAHLTLSTAKPGLGSLPPRLDPWYVDSYQPARSPASYAASQPALGSGFAYPAAPAAAPSEAVRMRAAELSLPPPPIRAEAATAEIRSEGGVVAFTVGGASDIPSDGEPHKTTIFAEDYTCAFEFIALPRLVAQSYLRATVTNGSAQILPGQAAIFRNNNFTGTTQLTSVAPGEEFKLNLGSDESVKVERTLVEREVDKTFLGNQRRTTYAYRITLTSLREGETVIEVSEQVPVSRTEQIKIKVTRSQPPLQTGELGLLEWKVTLPPKGKRELYFQFTVEHPRGIALTGLDI